MSGKNVVDPETRPEAPVSEPSSEPRARALSQAAAVPTAATGCFVGLDASGRALVEVDGREGEGAQAALCATDAVLAPGDSLALTFVDGDLRRPIVIGRLRAPRTSEAPVEELVLKAGEELTLRCGKASLVLTRAGKILLRGTYVSSHSSGVLRIKGGSVQIN